MNLLLSFFMVFSASVFGEDNGLSRLPDFQADWSAADLLPLKQIVGDAHWVGLGESIHTTEGFSQAKFRIIKYMVETLGFRALAFESGRGWRYALKTAKYVETCQGSPISALAGLAGTWKGQSVADLLKWLCEYNSSHPQDPVKFYSFDIQAQQEMDLADVETNLTKIVPYQVSPLMAGLSTCLGYAFRHDSDDTAYVAALRPYLDPNHPKNISALDQVKCSDGLDNIDSIVARHLESEPTNVDWKWLRISVTSIRGYQNFLYERTDTPRDRAMADELDYFHDLVAPHAKTVVWAHNDHLMLNGSTLQKPICFKDPVTGQDYEPSWSVTDGMGHFFGQKHGRDYLPIALTGYKVSVNYPGAWTGPIPPPPNPNSVEFMLHGRGARNWVLNLVGSYLDQRQTYTVADPPCQNPQVPSEHFAAIISLDQVEMMQAPN